MFGSKSELRDDYGMYFPHGLGSFFTDLSVTTDEESAVQES